METPESRPGEPPVNGSVSPRERFAMLYKQFLPRVFRYTSYKVANIAVAEDLTSLVFEKALVSFHRYNSDMASFSTWLFSIAHHTVADYFKLNNKRKHVSLDSVVNTSEEPDPMETLTKNEELQRLRGFLIQLSLQEQEIISLKFGAELTNRQIAGLLNLSESNVGVIVHRAVRKLRLDFREGSDG